MKENFDKKMQEILKTAQKGTTLLLHSCCAPCSSACLERLKDTFKITVLYYNPNIDEDEEYEKRKAEQIRFLKETGWAEFLDCDHEAEKFHEICKGLENEPERGKRCYRCYELRLKKTADAAKAGGYEYFGTTLSLSPYKNAEWLNEIGEEEGGRVEVKYLFSDFKKQGGYYRSLELSQEYGLYRQDFCGCVFSKAETERKRLAQSAKENL
ncbi:MAG: epoxyqueuosine reductase QueH [Clostridia bacterium]|nr:epoxyqueuosine reductase QueH [Clostridia bacterium]